MSFVKINNEKEKEIKNKEAALERSRAYKEEADPFFFKVQRGELSQQEWEAKVAEIRARYPYVS